MVRLEFPWPPRILTPNETERWGNQHAKRKARRNARTLGWGLTVQAKASANGEVGEIWIRVTATPPMKPGPVMDEDNLKASLKHYLDGISDALGVNDRQFRFAPVQWQPKAGAGLVVIEF